MAAELATAVAQLGDAVRQIQGEIAGILTQLGENERDLKGVIEREITAVKNEAAAKQLQTTGVIEALQETLKITMFFSIFIYLLDF